MSKKYVNPGEVSWPEVETAYVTGRASLEKIAAQFGISKSAAFKRSVKGGWTKKREDYRRACAENVKRKSARKDEARLSKLIDASQMAVDVAVRALGDDKQFNRYIVSDSIAPGVTETTEREFTKVDTRAFKELVTALSTLTGLMRDFYHIPTDAQAEAQRIAAERLELDKAKAAKDEAQAAESLEIIGLPEEYKS